MRQNIVSVDSYGVAVIKKAVDEIETTCIK
jgi:hypothetical protein